MTGDVGSKMLSSEAEEENAGRETPKMLFCLVLTLIQCFVLCELCLDIYISLKHSYNKISVTFQTMFTPTNQTEIDCFLPVKSLLQFKGRHNQPAGNTCPKMKTLWFFGVGWVIIN